MIVTKRLVEAMAEGAISIRERIRAVENEIEKEKPAPTVLRLCLESLEELRISECILENAITRYNEEKNGR
jgi:beta-phosphoglucomutase-like phosphatase (HAD superfamily)